MTKAANILTLIGLAIIPFGLWAPVIHQGHVFTMMLICFIGLALVLPNKWLSGFGLYVAAWWILVYAMTFIGRWVPEIRLITIDAILFIIFGMVVYLAVFYSKWTLTAWFNLICITALIQCFIAILQRFNLDPISSFLGLFITVGGDFPFNTPVGTLGNQNFLAAYLAIATPFFMRDKWFYFIPVIAYGLYIAHTSMAAMAVIIGMAYFIVGVKTSIVAVACIIAYAVFINQHDGLQNERVDMWLDGIKKITSSFHSILFGFGPGVQWKIGDQLHNEYLMAIWNHGLVGFSFVVGFILSISRQNRYLFTAFIILCIDCIGNHAMHTTPTALLAIIIFALIERERRQVS